MIKDHYEKFNTDLVRDRIIGVYFNCQHELEIINILGLMLIEVMSKDEIEIWKDRFFLIIDKLNISDTL